MSNKKFTNEEINLLSKNKQIIKSFPQSKSEIMRVKTRKTEKIK